MPRQDAKVPLSAMEGVPDAARRVIASRRPDAATASRLTSKHIVTVVPSAKDTVEDVEAVRPCLEPAADDVRQDRQSGA